MQPEKCKTNNVTKLILSYLGITAAITFIIVAVERFNGNSLTFRAIMFTFWMMLAWPYLLFMYVEEKWNCIMAWFNNTNESAID